MGAWLDCAEEAPGPSTSPTTKDTGGRLLLLLPLLLCAAIALASVTLSLPLLALNTRAPA